MNVRLAVVVVTVLALGQPAAAEEPFEPALWGTLGVGDLDGDGVPDLVVTGRSGDRGAVLALSGADGSDLWLHTEAGVTPELLPVELEDGAGVVAATWTGVAIPEAGTTPGNCSLSGFSCPAVHAGPARAREVILQGLDGSGNLTWQRQVPGVVELRATAYQPAVVQTGVTVDGSAAAGVLDRGDDASQVLVTVADRPSADGIDGLLRLLALDAGTGETVTEAAVAGPTAAIVLPDVTGDGVSDALGVHDDGRIWLVSGADLSVRWASTIPAGRIDAVRVARDATGDGHGELLVRLTAADLLPRSRVVAVGGADGATLLEADGFGLADAGDVSGDGLSELAVFRTHTDAGERVVTIEVVTATRTAVRTWERRGVGSITIGALSRFGDLGANEAADYPYRFHDGGVHTGGATISGVTGEDLPPAVGDGDGYLGSGAFTAVPDAAGTQRALVEAREVDGTVVLHGPGWTLALPDSAEDYQVNLQAGGAGGVIAEVRGMSRAGYPGLNVWSTAFKHIYLVDGASGALIARR